MLQKDQIERSSMATSLNEAILATTEPLNRRISGDGVVLPEGQVSGTITIPQNEMLSATTRARSDGSGHSGFLDLPNAIS